MGRVGLALWNRVAIPIGYLNNISAITSLQDGVRESVSVDFSRETYLQIVKIFTAPSDWILNISVASGEK